MSVDGKQAAAPGAAIDLTDEAGSAASAAANTATSGGATSSGKRPQLRTVVYLEGVGGTSSAPAAAVPNSSNGQLAQERQKRKALQGEVETSNKAIKQLQADNALLQAQAKRAAADVASLQAELAQAKRAAADASHTAEAAAKREEEAVKREAEAIKREEEVRAAASSGGGGGSDEASAEELFELRRLALDQYKLMLRDPKLAGKTSEKQWRLKLHRNGVNGVATHLCDDVLVYMENAKRPDMWRPTVVEFVGLVGPEDGLDQGGLTAEMHSSFWRDMLGAQSALFERGLPREKGDLNKLRCVGRMLCKSVLDDHPIGGGLARFVLHFLIDHHEVRVFGAVATALKALAEHEGEHSGSLAARWSAMLSTGSGFEGCNLSNFDESVEDAEDHEVHADNLEAAVLAGCRYRLLARRRNELNALRDGFTFKGSLDLSVQLAPFTSDELALMIQGRIDFSADDLISCFAWPQPPATTDLNAEDDTGEAAVQAALLEASGYLREWLSTACSEEQRLSLLQWATGYVALPLGGLKPDDRIKLIPKSGAGPDHLPEIHTCSHELELPPYKSLEQLQGKLLVALEHRMEGFHTE